MTGRSARFQRGGILLMSVNARYRLLQGGYWMLFCAGYGYVTVFLLAEGFSAGAIGVITALFGIFAAVLQPWLGRLADRGGRLGWKPLLLVLAALGLGDAVLLCLRPPQAVTGVLFGALLALALDYAAAVLERQGIPERRSRRLPQQI